MRLLIKFSVILTVTTCCSCSKIQSELSNNSVISYLHATDESNLYLEQGSNITAQVNSIAHFKRYPNPKLLLYIQPRLSQQGVLIPAISINYYLFLREVPILPN